MRHPQLWEPGRHSRARVAHVPTHFWYSSQVEFWSRTQFNVHTYVINVNSLHTLPGWFINYITSTLC